MAIEKRTALDLYDSIAHKLRQAESVCLLLSTADLDSDYSAAAGLAVDLVDKARDDADELWERLGRPRPGQSNTADAARALVEGLRVQCANLTEAECVKELARGEWDVQKLVNSAPGRIDATPDDTYGATHYWSLKGLRQMVAFERFQEAILPPEESDPQTALQERVEALGYELVIDARTGAQRVISGEHVLFAHRTAGDDELKDWLIGAERLGRKP